MKIIWITAEEVKERDISRWYVAKGNDIERDASNTLALCACSMATLHEQSEKRDTRTIYHVPYGPCRPFSSFLPLSILSCPSKGSYRLLSGRKYDPEWSSTYEPDEHNSKRWTCRPITQERRNWLLNLTVNWRN